MDGRCERRPGQRGALRPRLCLTCERAVPRCTSATIKKAAAATSGRGSATRRACAVASHVRCVVSRLQADGRAGRFCGSRSLLTWRFAAYDGVRQSCASHMHGWPLLRAAAESAWLLARAPSSLTGAPLHAHSPWPKCWRGGDRCSRVAALRATVTDAARRAAAAPAPPALAHPASRQVPTPLTLMHRASRRVLIDVTRRCAACDGGRGGVARCRSAHASYAHAPRLSADWCCTGCARALSHPRRFIRSPSRQELTRMRPHAATLRALPRVTRCASERRRCQR